MNTTIPLHSGSTVSDGQAIRQMAKEVLLGAWLDAAGGTATVKVNGRFQGGPWKLLVQFDLTGANDRAEYMLQEPWFELMAQFTVVSGGAKPTAAQTLN